jgi:parallel beta-helix repeat protein
MVNGVFFHNDILFNSDDGLHMAYMTDGNTITDNYFRGNEKFDIVFSASINNHLRHNDMSKGFTVINNDKESWLTLDIDGSNLLNGIPIRVYKNDMPSGIDLSSPMIYFINITGIDLDDYEASGTISSLRMIFCNEVTIDGSIFRGSAGEGLYTYYCQNVSIRNCTSYDNKVGFLIGGTFSVLVENCTTYDNSETGISAGVNGVQDSIIISNNHVHGNGGSGLEVSQISMNATCRVIGNVIEDNNGGLMYSSSKGGYSQDSPGSDIIQDNVIRNNPGSGLSLSLTHSHYLTRIEGNHIAGNGAGISIADSSGGGTIIEDNKVLKNNGTGIFGVLSNSYVNVSGEPIACGNFDNTIEGNDGYGVFFECHSRGGIPLENNVISNNSRTGVMFSDMSNAGPNRMVGNRIEGNGGVGIEMRSQMNAGYNPIEDNIIRYNKGWNGDYNEDRDAEQMIGGILIIYDI